jgi:CheY-like chemotaxis protein
MSKGTPNRNLQGEFIGYVGDCFDITDLRKAGEILDRNEKLEALGSLAGGIAHDFNNLFAGLFAYLEMARGDCADHPTALRHLDKALGTFGKAQDLTRRLLTFAKGGVPVRRPTDLGPLVLEAVRSGSPGWAVVPEVRVADGIPPCEVDPSQVTELVGHLVGNAVQALSQGGAVTIAVDLTVLGEGERPDLRAGSYARITVVDSGPGIPPGDLPRVFNPFFSTKKKGGGLGLPTCYSIARRHDGAIDIESEVGRGTRVQVYFPALAAAPVPDAGRPEARAGTGPVLVMDDDELIRGLMVEWLDAGGWPTVAAQDGAEALGRLDELLTQGTPPAFALLDLTVPGGQGGREILPAIRSRLPGLPIFAVSGYHDDPVMARPRDFGFTDRLPKPFLQADLLDMLARNLKEHP